MELINYLSTYGKVLTEHVGNKGIDKSELKNTDTFIFNRDVDWLKISDIMVADVTMPSLGVGYEIAFAESLNMPILCLFNPKHKNSLSAMILGNEKLICKEYNTVEEAKSCVSQFLSSISLKEL